MPTIKDIMQELHFQGKVAFAVGTGRCGTKFIHELMKRTPGVCSTHERHPLNDAFHRYCKWYNLPVDRRGFLKVKKEAINADLQTHTFSFESSAHLSLSIPELHRFFGAKILLMVRSPQDVVESYYKKGWYKATIYRDDPSLAPGLYSANPMPANLWHTWGRILPVDQIGQRWKGLTQVGRLSWYWNALIHKVLEDLESIPKTHYMVVKLEELSYNLYEKVLSFLDINERLSKPVYDKIAQRRPNKSRTHKTSVSWTEQEQAEYHEFVTPMANRLHYTNSTAVTKNYPAELKDAKNKSIQSLKLDRLVNRLRSVYQQFILNEFRGRFYRS
jgi:hypothetical protein